MTFKNKPGTESLGEETGLEMWGTLPINHLDLKAGGTRCLLVMNSVYGMI